MQAELTKLNTKGTDNRNRHPISDPSGKCRQARELVWALLKTIKSYRIYAPRNPILKRFVLQLYQRLGRYMKRHGPFQFDVEEFKFMVDGQVIYENENMTESLPFLMHRNGLRGLRFDPGIRYAELVDFLETFRSYEILKDSHEDLVTLLWDKDFSAIQFWATDDFLWAPLEIPQNMRDLVEKMEMPMAEQEAMEVEMPLPRWLFKPGKLEEAREKVPQEIEQIDYINLLMILAEIVSNSGKDGRDSKPVVDFFKIVLDKLLLRQDFKNLVKILSFTKILIRDRRLDSHEKAFVEGIRDYLGEPQSIERLMGSLTRFEHFDPEQLQKYLFQLTKTAIAPLCSVWLKIPSAVGRTAISNALAELGREDIPTLGSFVKHDQWQLVLNVVSILGKIGKDECVPYVARVMRHEHAKVRNEGLHALSRFSDEKAKALLPKFLNDQEVRVRINASRILARKLEADALPLLGPLITSGDFNKRELKEKRAFLGNLGTIEEPQSVEILEEILYRRAFVRRREWREIKSCIESVLASMDLNDAKVALANWKKKREKWFFRLLFSS